MNVHQLRSMVDLEHADPRRAQRPIPVDRLDLLESLQIRFPDFEDDGCSNAPDSFFGFDFRWACRLHDFAGCTRAHLPGALSSFGAALVAHHQLGRDVASSLPFAWRWVGSLYRSAVLWRGIWSWNTCGYEAQLVEDPKKVRAGLCRHGLPRPRWMVEPS